MEFILSLQLSQLGGLSSFGVSFLSGTVPAPTLESVTSPKNPGSFDWKMVLKAEVCILEATTPRAPCTSRPCQLTEQGKRV